MLLPDISKRTLGVNFNDRGQACVTLWAPGFETIEIVVKGKDAFPLQKAEYGYWSLVSDEIKEGDLYRFRLNKGKSFADPASVSQPEDVHGHSEALDLRSFQWTDDNWTNPPQEDYIIYELHTGTFTNEGSFAAIEDKLDHLLSLGINAIEIMPVAQFPGDRNWGYDGVYPFAAQYSYGGAKALQQLVNACHRKGLAVILDVVYNHLGPEGNYTAQFGPYFTNKYNTPWGQALNYDDAWCDGVRDYFIENALMWLRDFHIDALRMDAVQAIKDFSPVHILAEIKQYIGQLTASTGKDYYLIVECDLNDMRYLKPQEQCGFGMDATWSDEFHHALRVASGQEQTGYFSDFCGVEHLAKAYRDAWVFDGVYSQHRARRFGTRADIPDGKRFVVFSQNHDQAGNRMLGERTSALVSREMQKLLAAAVLVSPYVPMLFMGEEWSEPAPFLYFVSHTDPHLIEAVRMGRKAEFAIFHAQGEAPDPAAKETFERSKLNWHLPEEEPYSTMLRYYTALIQLRRQHPVLKRLDKHNVAAHANKDCNTLTLQRWQGEDRVIAFMNFAKNEVNADIGNIPAGSWRKLFDSAAPQWGGPKANADTLPASGELTLRPESILLFERHV